MRNSDVYASIQIKIVDTVLLDHGDITHYLFTNLDGFIAKKPPSFCTIAKIKEELSKYADKLPQGSRYVATAISSTSEGVQLIDYENMNQMLTTIPPHIDAIQYFVPSKGKACQYRTFRWPIISYNEMVIF